mgnify:FL=1|jgi:hypothetical protein
MQSLTNILEKIKVLETKLKKFLTSHDTEQKELIPAKEYMECFKYFNLILSLRLFSALTNQLQFSYSRETEEKVLGAYRSEITKYVK